MRSNSHGHSACVASLFAATATPTATPSANRPSSCQQDGAHGLLPILRSIVNDLSCRKPPDLRRTGPLCRPHFKHIACLSTVIFSTTLELIFSLLLPHPVLWPSPHLHISSLPSLRQSPFSLDGFYPGNTGALPSLATGDPPRSNKQSKTVLPPALALSSLRFRSHILLNEPVSYFSASPPIIFMCMAAETHPAQTLLRTSVNHSPRTLVHRGYLVVAQVHRGGRSSFHQLPGIRLPVGVCAVQRRHKRGPRPHHGSFGSPGEATVVEPGLCLSLPGQEAVEMVSRGGHKDHPASSGRNEVGGHQQTPAWTQCNQL